MVNKAIVTLSYMAMGPWGGHLSMAMAPLGVYFSVPRVIHRTPHGLMDSMDLVIKINKLKKRINGVHGLSMDSMDSKGLVSTFKKDTWSPWTFYGLHGL
jgi:hypothetical protein